jgi:RND family efflux transporter MFP subunit
MKKLVLGVVAVAILAAVGWQIYKRVVASSGPKGPNRSTAAVAVEIEPIRQGQIRDVGVFTGSLIPKSQFVVAPKVAGWLRELLVHVGDTVKQNQVVAHLDDAEFTQQVEQARAELQVAKATAENGANDLELAQREYDRAKALREKQIASASELDAAEADFKARQTQLKVSQAQVTQKEAALRAAELRLSYTQVQAFWEGEDQTRVVGERFVDEGALLQANQAIVSILQNDPLTAVVYVIERDYPKVHVGQQATVTTDAYPNRTFPGQIVRIAPLLRETSRQARVEIEIANPNQSLKPGMFVRAQVEFTHEENATLVPSAALVRRNDNEGVFIADMEAHKARFVAVTTGIVQGETVQIVEPAITGSVITIGNHLLEDNSDILLPQKRQDGDASKNNPRSGEAQ